MLTDRRTKILSVLIFLVSIFNVAIDLLNGGSFSLKLHYEEVVGALIGLTSLTQRLAVQKVQKNLNDLFEVIEGLKK